MLCRDGGRSFQPGRASRASLGIQRTSRREAGVRGPTSFDGKGDLWSGVGGWIHSCKLDRVEDA